MMHEKENGGKTNLWGQKGETGNRASGVGDPVQTEKTISWPKLIPYCPSAQGEDRKEWNPKKGFDNKNRRPGG